MSKLAWALTDGGTPCCCEICPYPPADYNCIVTCSGVLGCGGGSVPVNGTFTLPYSLGGYWQKEDFADGVGWQVFCDPVTGLNAYGYVFYGDFQFFSGYPGGLSPLPNAYAEGDCNGFVLGYGGTVTIEFVHV